MYKKGFENTEETIERDFKIHNVKEVFLGTCSEERKYYHQKNAIIGLKSGM